LVLVIKSMHAPHSSEIFVILQHHFILGGQKFYAYRQDVMKIRLSHKFIALSLISAFVLSACGIKGKLDTPPPLWGDKSKQSEDQKPQDKPESDN